MKNLYKNTRCQDLNFLIVPMETGGFELTVREISPEPKKLFAIHISRTQMLDMKKQMGMHEQQELEDLPF